MGLADSLLQAILAPSVAEARQAAVQNQVRLCLACSKHSPFPQHSITAMDLKHALAVAIVRQKRQARSEAAAWRAQAEQLRAELAEQQAGAEQLKQWAGRLLQQQQHGSGDGSSSSAAAAAPADEAAHGAGIFLPPLVLPAWPQPQQQGDSGTACGKAAALSDMLLTNVQMLLRLHTPPGEAAAAAGGGGTRAPLPDDAVGQLCSFMQRALLRVPSSSLRSAYMQQTAAALAGLLAAAGSGAAPDGAGDAACARSLGMPLPALRQQQQQQQAGQQQGGNAAARTAVATLQQLVACRAGGSAEPVAAAAAGAATALLQQLSTFPSTALLLLLAVAQQLQQHLHTLQQDAAVLAAVQLPGLRASLAAAEGVLARAASSFEACHGLITELVRRRAHLVLRNACACPSSQAAATPSRRCCSHASLPPPTALVAAAG